MEMEMRGKDDMEMGEDVTPSLPPLSFSLNDSLLSSHCSACFSPLPPLFPPPFPPPFPPTLLYCSSQCSNYDSALHHSSAESQLLHLLRSRPSTFPHSAESSDLRLALRLIIQSHSSKCHSAARLAGLLTNRDKLTASFGSCDEILLRISEGARAMALARRMRDGLDFSSSEDEVSIEDVRLEESALCLVLTNAVEVQDNKTGRTLGVALYGQNFSWINHSCSPNACYRILLPSEIETSPFSPEETPLRIAPCCSGNEEETQVIKSGVCSSDVLKKEFQVCYGPRMIVRSIKRIKKGEEVTVAYTDLLQPKAMRQSDLWSRYRFICCCRRCNALPPTFVDRALEEISVVNVHSSCTSGDFDKDKATDMLNQYIDDAIADYLSLGDPQSCCEKLERVVTQGLFDEHLECKGTTPQPTYWMHPLHHLSLNAYTTLASAYKIRSNDLLASLSETHKNLYEAFDMSRTSAAYSLLLAGATNYLFQFEPSLIASAANFWASAGESLLDFARSSIWSKFLPASNLSSFTKYKCPKCSLREKVIQISISRHIKRETNLLRGQAQYSDFENISSQFLNCITNLTERAWLFLTRSCHHLKVFKDPIDFGWLATRRYVDLWDSPIHSGDTNVGSSTDTKEAISENEAQGFGNHGRIHLLQLGFHCLLYGSYLGSLCFGEHSHLVCHVQNILECEEDSKDYCEL